MLFGTDVQTCNKMVARKQFICRWYILRCWYRENVDAKAAIFISTIIHVLEQTSSVCPTIGILDRKNSNTQNIVISKYTYISNYL